MPLRVDPPQAGGAPILVLGVPIEMNGQMRHPQDWFIDAHQPIAAVPQRQAAGNAEVAIEPRPQDGASVGLERDDGGRAAGINIVTLLEPQVGAVSVAADDAEAGHWIAGRSPGDEGSPARHVVRARIRRPCVPFIQPLETGRVQLLRDRCDNVERRGRAAR